MLYILTQKGRPDLVWVASYGAMNSIVSTATTYATRRSAEIAQAYILDRFGIQAEIRTHKSYAKQRVAQRAA